MYVIGESEIRAVGRVIKSGQLFRYRGGEGGQCDTFEKELCAKLDAKYSLILTSGTGALMCALAGAQIGPGDEVIVPAYTFMATPLAVLAVGAIPVIAEVDDSLLLDPADFARKITPRTKAVIPVDMVGLPCDMDAILEIAGKRKLKVVEDACQAVGGSYKGRRLTTLGDVGAFSFNHFKIISCGEGGAVVTNDRRIYEGALIQHDGGCAFRIHAGAMRVPIYTGQTMRASEILGAIMREQLKRLDGILARLRQRKAIVRETLAGSRAYSLAPIHDVKGDCGVLTAIQVEDEKAMRAAQKALKAQKLDMGSPIDSGMHVYSNWEPILNQRASHHPKLNPYHLTDKKYTYTKDMCPRTTAVLSRTLYCYTHYRETPAQARARARAVRKVLEAL